MPLGGRKPQFVRTGPHNSGKEEEMMKEGFASRNPPGSAQTQ